MPSKNKTNEYLQPTLRGKVYACPHHPAARLKKSEDGKLKCWMCDYEIREEDIVDEV